MSSFKVQRDVVANSIITKNITPQKYTFELEFTGPFTKTVTASASLVGNIWSLCIPGFNDTTVNPGINAILAHLPDWLPAPARSASMSCPILNASAITAGYVTALEGEGRIVLIIPLPRVVYTAGCGLSDDIILQYTV